MSEKYGGKQSKLRTSLMKQGQFPRILNPGDVQSMVFLPGDEGPFWMTAEQWQSTRSDVKIQEKKTKKKLTKEEPTMKLAERGIIAQGNMTNIKCLCTQQAIPVEIEVTKIQHGWEGSAKGKLQVLWE